MTVLDKICITVVLVVFMIRFPALFLEELRNLVNVLFGAVGLFTETVEEVFVPPKPKLSTLQLYGFHRLHSLLNNFTLQALDFEMMVYFGLVIGVVSIVLLWVVARMLVRSSIKRAILRMRGVIIGESMQPGSEFKEEAMPKWQLSFNIPGTFTDSHQGYGVRMPGCVVTAKHVLSGFVGQEIVIKNSTGKLKHLWQVRYEESDVFPDVAFCIISDDILSKLHATVAPISRSALNTHADATAYGQKGKSVGQVRKNVNSDGLIIYTGSTIPGMSGGGIITNGAVVGIHMGNLEGYNVSACAYWIREELRVRGFAEAVDVKKNKAAGGSDWDAVKGLVGPRQKLNSWQVTTTPPQLTGWANIDGKTWAELDSEAITIQDTKFVALDDVRKFFKGYRPQAMETPILMEKESVQVPPVEDKGTSVPLKKVPFCLQCKKIFQSINGYADHCKKMHSGKLEKEAVTLEYDDTGVEVPVDFLEEQNPSLVGRLKNSRKDLNLETSSSPLTSSQQYHQECLTLARSTTN